MTTNSTSDRAVVAKAARRAERSAISFGDRKYIERNIPTSRSLTERLLADHRALMPRRFWKNRVEFPWTIPPRLSGGAMRVLMCKASGCVFRADCARA